jgi:hypothetical protein
LAIALAAATVITASRVQATSLTFYLNQSGTGPTGTGGTIVIDDALAGEGPNTVDILVTLNPGYGFVKTGAGDALAFNLSGHPAITINDITSGFAIGPTNVSEPPFGTFNYAVSCTSGCGKGGSAPNPGPLTFDVVLSNISLQSFIGNNSNNGNFYFASDVMSPTGATGNVGSLGPETPVPTPEPASMLLLGGGLLGLAAKMRQRRKKAQI